MRIFTISSLRGVLLLSAALQQVVSGQTHPEVLIVYNSNSSDSLSVAQHYMTARNIPTQNLCAIAPPATDGLTASDYATYVKTPVQNCLNTLGSKSILYIVMSYLTPYALVAAPQGLAAVDSYLADIWDKYLSQPFLIVPNLTQPYYADSQSQGNSYSPFQTFAAYRANSRNPLIYSVWRLDGPSAAIATALVDQAMQAEAAGGPLGPACIDRRFGDISNAVDAGYFTGDWDLRMASSFLQQAGLTVLEDANPQEFGTTPAPLCPNAAFYSGWYSYNYYNDAFTWNTGAIGWHLDSVAAVNLRSGPSWVPNALLKGITVTTGPVGEPYLQGMVRPGGAFRNLLEGANVGDAFLRNTRWLKWMIVNIGDPLYKPFGSGLAPFHPLQPVNSFQIAPQEIAGGTNSTGTITLSAAAPPGGTTFSLSPVSGITTPATVTIPAGSTKASFAITTAATTQYTNNIITATAGALSLQNTFNVDPLMGGFAQSMGTTMAGIPVNCTAILNGRAPAGGATIVLSSDNAAVTVPPTVTVPAGSMVATFTAMTTPVATAVTANIVGTYAGAAAGFSISIVPGISLFGSAPTSINAGGSLQIEVHTGIFMPAGYSATVQLTSSDPASLPVPPTMTIPSGFILSDLTLTSTAGSSGKVVTLTAIYGGSTATTTITIN